MIGKCGHRIGYPGAACIQTLSPPTCTLGLSTLPVPVLVARLVLLLAIIGIVAPPFLPAKALHPIPIEKLRVVVKGDCGPAA